MRRRSLLGLTPALLSWPAAWAEQTFPSRPISLVVPFGPGGVADVTARTVGKAMAERLGQPVVVDNRPGAGGIAATQAVLRGPADGHSLLLISNATAVSVHLMKKLPFDVQKDLVPITTLGFFELALAVPAASRFKNLQDLLAWGRAHPGKLNIATIAVGSTQHLAAELFKARTGVDVAIVPYKNSPAVITALRAGEVDLGIDILSPLLPQFKAGTLRALATTGPQRNPLLPEVSTAQELGLAHFEVSSWNALAAPTGTPLANLDRLRQAAQDALAQPAVRQVLRDQGVRPQAGTPAELQALLASEIRHWGEVVRAAHIEPE